MFPLKPFKPVIAKQSQYAIASAFGLAMTITFILAGCGKISSPPPVNTRQGAVDKFQKIANEEIHVPAVIRDLKNTVWIYVPLEERIVENQATPQSASPVDPNAPTPEPQTKVILKFLKVTYKDSAFHIEYDISPMKLYPGADSGYQTMHPGEFLQKQQNILSAVGRSYLDMELVPGDVEYSDAEKQATHKQLVDAYVKTEKAPEFFVIIFADIVRGIKMVNTTHFKDLQSTMSTIDTMPQEEYTLRFLNEVKGDAALIGDKNGENLQFRDIAMPEFLARQIENRVSFKYNASSFPPGPDVIKEILLIVAETTRAYEFKNFNLVQLRDLNSGKTMSFKPSQLKTFQEK